jgi:hypothetical protein
MCTQALDAPPGSSSTAQREELRAACTGGLARVLLHMGDVQAGKAMAVQVCILNIPYLCSKTPPPPLHHNHK